MRIFLYSLLFALAIACEDKLSETCYTENPAEDLAWLKADIDAMLQNTNFSHYYYVTRTTYKLEPVFIFGNCCPTCSSIFEVKNCSGELVGVLGSGENDVPIWLLENDILVWKAENSVCPL